MPSFYDDDPNLRFFRMSKKVYVGNMNYSTAENQLRDLFAQYGEVSSVNIIIDRYTGKAKGFGFVEMINDDEAQKAIDALNGFEFMGRQLRVNEAEDKPRRDGGSFRPRRY
ncbi:MAG: RNP-1 like RNA-binding protein [Spirochaetes bacterium]|nr:MAG: RNP-1 like RNA-binding protein [Spirochaetota bacterium]